MSFFRLHFMWVGNKSVWTYGTHTAQNHEIFHRFAFRFEFLHGDTGWIPRYFRHTLSAQRLCKGLERMPLTRKWMSKTFPWRLSYLGSVNTWAHNVTTALKDVDIERLFANIAQCDNDVAYDYKEMYLLLNLTNGKNAAFKPNLWYYMLKPILCHEKYVLINISKYQRFRRAQFRSDILLQQVKLVDAEIYS